MKRVRKSKTINLNGLGLLGLFVPYFDDWIGKHPKEVIAAVLAINILLRLFTKDKVQLELPKVLKKMGKFYSFFIIALAGLCLGVSNCSQIPVDRAMAAADGNDYVIVLSGLGQKSTKGYLFGQVRDKAATTSVVTAVFPASSCKRESCVRFQFFRKDGSFGYAGALPKGQTQALVPLSAILGHDGLVSPLDEGEYSVVAQVFYTGPDDQEYSVVGNGFVRVNVLNELYRPVACGDPNIAWKVKAGDNCEAQYTTAFRSAACGGGCQ